MGFSLALVRTFTIIIVATLVAACSALSNTVPISDGSGQMATQSGDLSPVRNRHVNDGRAVSGIYVSQWYETPIGEYILPDKSNHGPSCAVAAAEDVPDLGVDKSGTLYVPEQLKQQIATFAPSCGEAGPVLTEPGSGAPAYPEDVAFDNAKGIVYVSNLYGPGSNGDVGVFPPHALEPKNYLSDPSEDTGFGVAVDSGGDVFQVAQRPYSHAHEIIEWKAGKMPGAILLATGFSSPVGIMFDGKNNMLLVDVTEGVLKYAPPYSGAPSRVYKLKNYGAAYGKLNGKNTKMFIASANGSSIDIYSYPKGKYLYSITAGLSASGSVSGLALDPNFSH
jgi:hypothetical protein